MSDKEIIIDETVLTYIEQDDEYMYFEVFYWDGWKHVSKGTIYIGKVKGIDREVNVDGKR